MSNQLLMRRRASIAKKEEVPCVKFTAMEDGCDVTLGKVGSPTTGVFEYSVNSNTFLPYTVGDLVQLDEGDTVKFRRPKGSSITTLNESDTRYYKFSTNGEIVCDAMPTALLTCDGKVTSVVNVCFYNLFNTTHDGLTINITVPDGVVSCGFLSFANFGSVASFAFTNSVVEFFKTATSWANGVFKSTQIDRVLYKGTVDDWCDIVFGNADSNPIVYNGQLYINDTLLEDVVISRLKAYTFHNALCLKTMRFENYTQNNIPYSSFYNCKNLRGNIVIPEGVTTIGGEAFYYYGNNIQSNNTLTLPSSLTTLGTGAFKNANIRGDLTIPSSVSTVPSNSFAGTKLNGKVVFESGVTEILSGFPISIKEIYFSNTLTTLGVRSFTGEYTKRNKIVLYGDNITLIDSYNNALNATDFYYYGDITSVCNAKLSTIHTYMTCDNFYVNDVLVTELTIDSDIPNLNMWLPCGKPITKIKFNGNITNCIASAFTYCPNLTQVIFTQQIPPITSGNISLSGSTNSIKFYVPYSADHSVLNAYQTATGWSAVANKIYELDENWEIPE